MLVLVQDLKAGMILGEDIMNNDGVIYLSEGMELTDRHIRNFDNFDIEIINIKEAVVEEINEGKILTESELYSKRINEEYTKTIESFKKLYENVRLGKHVVMEDVRGNISPLLSEISTNNNILGSLRMIKANDEYTYTHSVNVGLISSMIGKWLNYSETDLSNLAVAGFMHDLGKCKVPLEILNKPSKLTEQEFEIMKMHSTHSYQILENADESNFDTMFGVLEHHEKTDGTGYPNGKKGSEIHEFAKIIAVADIFDALTSNRVYKSKMSPFKVAEILMEEAVNHLDPKITQLFIRKIAHFYVGNMVKLNNGEIGEVILVNKFNFTRPLIRAGEKFYDLATNYKLEIVEVLD